MTMPKRRTANFRDDETRILIQLWGSPTIQAQMNSCHRKAPIMVQLATLMQQYGFYRTPEEITTRIRNLKCIYHRIKKSLKTGIGLVDPDWHHFKAIDAILGDTSLADRVNRITAEMIKKEKQDDDTMHSNGSQSSLYDDNNKEMSGLCSSPPMQGLTITSSTMVNGGPSPTSASERGHIGSYGQEVTIEKLLGLKRRQLSAYAATVSQADTSRVHDNSSEENKFSSPGPKRKCLPILQNGSEVASLLRQLLDVEKEHLQLERERLDFDRMVGSQLLALVPMVGNILQTHYVSQQQQSPPSQSNYESKIHSEPEATAAAHLLQDDSDSDSEEFEGESILQTFEQLQSNIQTEQLHSDVQTDVEKEKNPVSSSLSDDRAEEGPSQSKKPYNSESSSYDSSLQESLVIDSCSEVQIDDKK